MSLNITKEIARMKRMATAELKDHYEDVCGHTPRSHNRDWLVKKIAWQMQAAEEGGLPERVRQRALAMADDADLRTRPSRTFTQQIETANERTCLVNEESRDPRLPPAGTLLSKSYKGQTITVLVGQEDFKFNGDTYKTLSAIANALPVHNSIAAMSLFRGLSQTGHETMRVPVITCFANHSVFKSRH